MTVFVGAALPRRMRPAKVREQASCPLQFFELGHFRTVIKGQSLPQAWWHLAQTRNKRLARGGGRLVLGLGQQQKATFALLATEQLCLTPGGADQIRPTPQRGRSRQQAVAVEL